MIVYRIALALLVAGLGGCGNDDRPSARDSANDVIQDSDAGDTPGLDVPDATLGPDLSEPDAVMDGGGDAPEAIGPGDGSDGSDATDGGDTFGPVTAVATPGARCAPHTQVGEISVTEGWSERPALQASVWVSHHRNPLVGPATVTDGACALHGDTRDLAACGVCADDSLCGQGGRCEPLPMPRTDVTLTLMVGEQSQRFPTMRPDITLPGRTFAGRIEVGEDVITFAEIELPRPLEELEGVVIGGTESPEGVTITWSPEASDSTVSTQVPMNHHVEDESFTSCAVPASAGRLDIPGALVRPLAIDTGLEMQGVYHARYAAAEMPWGCVQIRFYVFQRPTGF